MVYVIVSILTAVIVAQGISMELRQRAHEEERNRLINALLARHLPEKAYAGVVEKQKMPTTSDHINMGNIIMTEEPEPKDEQSQRTRRRKQEEPAPEFPGMV